MIPARPRTLQSQKQPKGLGVASETPNQMVSICCYGPRVGAEPLACVEQKGAATKAIPTDGSVAEIRVVISECPPVPEEEPEDGDDPEAGDAPDGAVQPPDPTPPDDDETASGGSLAPTLGGPSAGGARALGSPILYDHWIMHQASWSGEGPWLDSRLICRIEAPSREKAEDRADALIQQGPGLPVHPDVQVDLWSRIDHPDLLGQTTIDLFLPEPFAMVVVEVDGIVVAELEDATLTPMLHGWWHASVDVDLLAWAGTQSVTVHTMGLIAAEPITTELDV